MRRPAVFFDRDNTLIVGADYLGDPEDVVLMTGAADAVSRARALGYATVVVSNQSGVARGMFTEADVRAVNSRLEEYLREDNPNAVIDRQEFCPFHPEGSVERYRRESDLRKPKPGMILKAAELLAIDLPRSWVIGDAPRDIEAGRAAGCKTILFTPEGVEASPAAGEVSPVKADYTCNTLKDAIDYIAAQSNGSKLRTPAEGQSTQAPTLRGTESKPTEPKAPEQKTPEPRTPESKTPEPKQIKTNPPAPPAGPEGFHRIERLLEQILDEVKRSQHAPIDFSVSKLMAGITQILAIAVLFVAYLNRNSNDVMFGLIFTAVFAELLTIALLIMDRQR